MPDGLLVRAATPRERPAIDAFLHAHNADLVARRGELVDARTQPALIALDAGRIAGVVTYVAGDRACEALTVHAADPGNGAGTALVDALRSLAAASGWRRIWLVTTNDNVDALRFYQRRGFRLAALHRGAVDASRTRLKPGIPELGAHGIPIHDELELELLIDQHDDAP